jgi:membrane protease YdiL (CAAX protease family)
VHNILSSQHEAPMSGIPRKGANLQVSGGSHLDKAAVTAGLLLIFVLPLLPLPRELYGITVHTLKVGWPTASVLIGILTASVSGGALILLVTTWEKKPLTSIGISQLSPIDIFLGVIGWYVAELLKYHVILWNLKSSAHLASPAVPSSVLSVLGAPLALRVLLSVFVGVVEELGCRGFTIERALTASGSIWFAGACAISLSLGAHIPRWGPGDLLYLAPGQFVFTALYCWRRNLAPSVVAHVLSDSYGMWLSGLVPVRIYY